MKHAWNHNIEYHGLVLAGVPLACVRALDVGCGSGVLVRRLALQCDEVTGIDKSSEMIAAAGAETKQANVSFVVGDVMTYPFPPGNFTFISTVATLHHLPLQPALVRLLELLAPGGTLVVIGLYRAEGWRDAFASVAGLLASRAMRCVRCFGGDVSPMQAPRETLVEIRSAATYVLPGCIFNRRLFFRYSLVWQKAPE